MELPAFLREPARKIFLKEIEDGEFVNGNEREPNYFLTKDKKKIFRINIIAIVVQKEIIGTITNVFLDDGSGTATLRSFEESNAIKNLNLGEVVIVIGKIRTYNQEKYISSEIVKKIDALWLKQRFLELNKKEENCGKKIERTIKNKEIEELKMIDIKNNNFDDEIVEEIVVNEQTEQVLPKEKVINIIKELDQGDGALIEEIIHKSSIKETEKLLEKMLERGDIFQNQPGKVKIL